MFADPYVAVFTSATALTDALLSGAGMVAQNFVCTGRGPTSSTYRYTVSSSHFIDMLISRQAGKRTRYTVRFTESELVADPIDSSVNSVKTATIYFVADVGVLGTTTNWQKLCNSLATDFLLKSTDGTPGVDLLLQGQT